MGGQRSIGDVLKPKRCYAGTHRCRKCYAGCSLAHSQLTSQRCFPDAAENAQGACGAAIGNALFWRTKVRRCANAAARERDHTAAERCPARGLVRCCARQVTVR
ncbi:hypothetical protein TRVL_03359 [Trypanosoma vivax]|nr:hypothetical protein TRVL_03359 [Trypanosoma vivax]